MQQLRSHILKAVMRAVELSRDVTSASVAVHETENTHDLASHIQLVPVGVQHQCGR
jgi:hypothetical protein